MLRVIFSDGVELFAADLQAVEEYQATEVKTRWNHLVETPGIVAKTYDANILMPTSGATSGTVTVSAGGVYFPNGEYVYFTGGSLTGLTDADMFPTGNTYVAVEQVDTTGATRPHVVYFTDNLLPTRGWNDNGVVALALVNAATGAAFIIVGKVDDISVGGDVTLNTGETYRRTMMMPLRTLPTTPVITSVGIGSEVDSFEHSGTPRARRTEFTPAYLSVAWNASEHEDGILGYYAVLDFLDNSNNVLTGASQSQLQYIGTGMGVTHTGMTFHQLSPGSKCQLRLYALSNSSIPVLSQAATGGPYYVGSGLTLTMPEIVLEETYGGLLVTWEATGTTNATLFEVFASTGASLTGSTGSSIDYNQLSYRGYGSRAFIPGQIDDVVYIVARALDYSGALSSNAQITSTTLQGPTAPPAPVSVRLTGVRNPEISDLECDPDWKNDKFSIAMRGGIIWDKANTVWEWNYNDLTGTGDTGGIFRVSANGTGITSNLLVDLHLYLNANTTDYLITANTASNAAGKLAIGVCNLDGSVANVNGVEATALLPAIVHSNADEYEVEFRVYTDDGLSYEIPVRRARSVPLAWKDPIVPQTVEAELPIGIRAQCNVKSIERGTHRSSIRTYSDVERVEYADNDVWNDTGSLTCVGTEYGFEIIMSPASMLPDISGWEIAYCQDTQGTPSFSNRSHNPQVISAVDHFRIAIERVAVYNVAVRPVKGGQAVGVTRYTSVGAGGGGYVSNIKHFEVPVDLMPMGLVLKCPDVNTAPKVSVVVYSGGTPTSSGNPCPFPRVGQRGGISYFNYPVYKIVSVHNYAATGTAFAGLGNPTACAIGLDEETTYNYDLTAMTHTAAVCMVDGGPVGSLPQVQIKMLRQIAKIPIYRPIQVIKVGFDCTYTDASSGNPALLRIYQQGLEASGATLSVSSFKTGPIMGNANVIIDSQSIGTFASLCIDAYNSDSGVTYSNAIRIQGTLHIYYRDLRIDDQTIYAYTKQPITSQGQSQ